MNVAIRNQKATRNEDGTLVYEGACARGQIILWAEGLELLEKGSEEKVLGCVIEVKEDADPDTGKYVSINLRNVDGLFQERIVGAKYTLFTSVVNSKGKRIIENDMKEKR